MMRLPSAAVLSAVLLWTGAAFAQSSSTSPSAQDGAPRLPAPSDQVPDKVRPDTGTGSGQTLSDKLEKSDGVIKPPSGVDPEIRTIAPDPSPNSMPIIKPPTDAK